MAAVDALITRQKKAEGIAQTHWSHMREVYYWFDPSRYATVVGGQADGQKTNRALYSHIFDDTGPNSFHDGAAQIAEAVHPWDQVWAAWSPAMDAENDKVQAEQLRQIADRAIDVCFQLIKRSNLDVEAVKSHKDFFVCGGFLLVEPDPTKPNRVRCTALEPMNMAIEESYGTITGYFMKKSVSARELPFMFSGKPSFSDETAKLIDDANTGDEKVEICISYTLDSKTKRWKLCTFETKARHVIEEDEDKYSRIICYRDNVSAGQAWGSGAASRMLATVKTCNKVVELVLKNASIAVTGIWQAEDDGVLNPANLKLVPGSIIPKAAGSSGLTPLEAPGRFDVSDLVLTDLRDMIKRAFYVTKVEERDMTAREYGGRVSQQMRDMRAVYGMLRSDFAESLMLRFMEIAEKMGMIETAEFEQIMNFALTGPLAQDVAGDEIERLLRTHGTLTQMFGPEMSAGLMEWQEAVPWVVQKHHSPMELFKDGAQIQELGDQVAQMAAQMMAQQMAAQGGPPEEGMPV